MKRILLLITLVFSFAARSQTKLIDTLETLNKNDWIQTTKVRTQFNKFKNDSKLILFKNRKWGNEITEEKFKTFILGRWEFKNQKIIIYDSSLHGIGISFDILKLSSEILIIKHINFEGKDEIIELKTLHNKV